MIGVSMITRTGLFNAIPFLALMLLSSCFYPPTTPPPAPERTQVVLQLPYDLALDAVMHVIKAHEFRIQANDPTHGVIEAQTVKFTLDDADCGIVGMALGKEPAAPTQDSSVVYTFHVKAAGFESSTVAIQAVFASPLHVPFHPLSEAQCVSRGVQEAKLLKEIEQEAAVTHRPTYKPPMASEPTAAPPVVVIMPTPVVAPPNSWTPTRSTISK
jgi:hypothetical protein